MKVVFAVGAGGGAPYEVWALYVSAVEAQRHADAAAFVFDVFAMPVYEVYGEAPAFLRPETQTDLQRWAEQAIDESALARAALDSGEAPLYPAGPVSAVGDFDSTQLREVRLLFTRAVDAERYLDESLAAATGQQWLEVMLVYEAYEQCPPDKRHDRPGPAISQLIQPR